MKIYFDSISDKYLSYFQTDKGKKLKIAVTIILVMAIFFSQLFFNLMSGLIADDYSYSFSWENKERLESVNQLIPSIIAHNQILNGRSVNHFIAQFFLLLNNLGFGIVFELANSFIYIALILLIYYHSKGTFKNFNLLWLSSIHLCLWLFIPDYAGSFFWLIGSCNYSWSIVMVLLFFIPFTYHSNRITDKKTNIFLQIILALLYIPFGIIAGNTNENTAVAVVVMIILFCTKLIIEKKKLRVWMFTGLIGVLVGFGAILSSPGQHIRTESVGGLGGIGTWLKNAYSITTNVFGYLDIPLLLLVITLAFVFATNKKLELKHFNNFFIFFCASGCAIYCMIVAPFFPPRTWTPPIIFAIIAFGQLLSLVKSNDKVFQRVVCATLAIGILCFGINYASSTVIAIKTASAQKEREEYIAQQIEKGETTLLLSPISAWSKYNIFSSCIDLADSSDEWPNTAIAQYYGVEKVINTNSTEGILYENSKQNSTD